MPIMNDQHEPYNNTDLQHQASRFAPKKQKQKSSVLNLLQLIHQHIFE